MHSAARKIQHPTQEAQKPAEIFDFNHLTRIQVAVQAEKACHLAANAAAPDFEAFLAQYGRGGITSDFA